MSEQAEVTEVSELRVDSGEPPLRPRERQGTKAQEQSSVPRLPGPGASINHLASFRSLPEVPRPSISAQAYLPLRTAALRALGTHILQSYIGVRAQSSERQCHSRLCPGPDGPA